MWRLKKLFWKIFLTVWLVSALGMVSVFILVASSDDQARWKHIIGTQFKSQAAILIEQYEEVQSTYGNTDTLMDEDIDRFLWMLPPEPRQESGRHAFPREEPRNILGAVSGRPQPPVWLYQLTDDGALGDKLVGPPHEALRNAFTLDIQADSGRVYRLIIELPPSFASMERFTHYLLSVQMVLVLAAAALSAFILSIVLVRPIEQLSKHVHRIYHEGDLTARASEKLSQRQDELGDLTREFDQMADYVEKTLQNQQRLLQDVSHELRAPMARLQVGAGLAEQQLGQDSPLAARINRECERLDGLIAEILSYSRLEKAQKVGHAFSVSVLFEELAGDLHFSQPERPVTLKIKPEGLSLSLNRDLLCRALRNGIENALKYTPSESLLELSAHKEMQQVVITLRDHGEGVSDRLLEELFIPFVRGSGGHGEGYGLGMSIAKRAVERLGGTLSAENHLDGGLVLIIKLTV
ncbi:ATP-binding protein [Oceanospirillum maris]|uniref:ATP-binding protein n=1 Tax=Oceanospirillum maris TaxID=64977 RepID=UPI0003F9CC9B|nr:ATP-binding protein [Oceanospirillum maris]